MNAENTIEIDYSRQLRVLVVDDVAVHRMLLMSGLNRLNPFMKVDEACSGSEAIAKLEGAERYNAVVCDWLMPNGSGEDLLRWMRARPHFKRVPFIMFSGKTDSQEIIKAFMELGVDGYVVKPFTPRDVYQKVVDSIDKLAQRNDARKSSR
jgi:CheY-like chemotaxis protein